MISPQYRSFLRERAAQTFALAGVEDDRAYSGYATGIPAVTVPASFVVQAKRSFNKGEDNMLDQFALTRSICARPLNRQSNNIPQRAKSLFHEADPRSLRIQSDPRDPGYELAHPLLYTANEAARNGHSRNSCALIAPDGKVLMVMGSEDADNPLNTPLMRMTVAYERIRQSSKGLPNRPDCTVVLLNGVNESPLGLMDIALMKSRVMHVIPGADSHAVSEVISSLPNYYRRVNNGGPKQVSNEALVSACMNARCNHG